MDTDDDMRSEGSDSGRHVAEFNGKTRGFGINRFNSEETGKT